ncbi:MAG: thioredoxin family protein, partial [Ignavibacteria bacterium]|nr:thioredoxin family protein [Ignavibacteria bacterium]
DINNIIADKYGAAVTPEIFVLNGNLELLYHGRIDDNRKASKVEVNDLRNALDEILSGKPVSVQSTKAFGCTIKRVNK